MTKIIARRIGEGTGRHATTRISGPLLREVQRYVADSTGLPRLNTRRVIDAAVSEWLAQRGSAENLAA